VFIISILGKAIRLPRHWTPAIKNAGVTEGWTLAEGIPIAKRVEVSATGRFAVLSQFRVRALVEFLSNIAPILPWRVVQIQSNQPIIFLLFSLEYKLGARWSRVKCTLCGDQANQL
jgi:hypothetical protein